MEDSDRHLGVVTGVVCLIVAGITVGGMGVAVESACEGGGGIRGTLVIVVAAIVLVAGVWYVDPRLWQVKRRVRSGIVVCLIVAAVFAFFGGLFALSVDGSCGE